MWLIKVVSFQAILNFPEMVFSVCSVPLWFNFNCRAEDKGARGGNLSVFIRVIRGSNGLGELHSLALAATGGGDLLRHELGHDRAARFTTDRFEVFPDECAH